MTLRYSALKVLMRCLNIAPKSLDWDSVAWEEVLSAANDHLLTPALHNALVRRRELSLVPDDVSAYLAHLADANRSRNNLLRKQGIEVAAVLNGAGIKPLFLKSAADLMERAPVLGDDGIVGDLDVLVQPGQHAVDALTDAGYQRRGESHPSPHTEANMSRAGCAAWIDLHTNVVNFEHLLPTSEVFQRAKEVEVSGVRFFVPAAGDRFLHRLLHDQVQDRTLYTGRMRLGNVWRTAWMLEHHASIVNWSEMTRRLGIQQLTMALGAEILAASLFGAPTPIRPSTASRALHGWRLLRLAFPNVNLAGQSLSGFVAGHADWRYGSRRQA